MRRIFTFRRLLFAVGAVALVGAVVLGTNLASKTVAAQVSTQDVIIFHCSVIANEPDFFALGFSHYTQSANAPNVNPSSCAQVMADVLNAGFRLKSALVLPNGGPGGTGATEYVFVRGGNQ